jgi:O-antigen ligase
MLYAENTKEAIFKLQQKSPLLIFPIILGTTKIVTATVFHRAFKALTLFTFFACLTCVSWGVYKYFNTNDTGFMHGYILVVLKDMPAHVLGLCCLLSISYILYQSFQRKDASGKTKVIGAEIMVAVFLLVFLLLMGNRSILICTLATILFFSFAFIRSTIRRIMLLSAISLFCVGAVIFNPSLNRQWKDMVDFSSENKIQLDKDESREKNWGGKTIRFSIWKCAADIVKQHWLIGVGTGDEQDALQEAYIKRKFHFATGVTTFNAHNQYLQETIAHGIIGLLVFLGCILVPIFIYGIGNRNILYTIFLLSFAFVCLTESTLELSKGVIWYSMFNCIFCFQSQMPNNKAKE